MTIKFITGPAGSGKSHLFRSMIEKEERSYLKVAPTGIAAINIEGSTIHSAFQIDINTYMVGKKWREVEVLYIDEISMVGSQLFRAALKGVPNATEIIVFGDMAQLPPIRDKYFFEGIEGIEKQILTTQYRQNDPEFTRVLNAIRAGKAKYKDIQYLNDNTCEFDKQSITLAFKNKTVDDINYEEVHSLGTEVKTFEAKYSGNFKPNDCIADEKLNLAVGANIIMINNDSEKRYVNGTRGVVKKIDKGSIDVLLGDGVHTIYTHLWQKQKPMEVGEQRKEELHEEIQKLNNTPKLSLREEKIVEKQIMAKLHAIETGIEYVVTGSCQQYPIKLAYALTVHKSQGLTLDKIHIIPDGFSLNHGIGYVALSRGRSINSISLENDLNISHFKFDSKIENWVI